MVCFNVIIGNGDATSGEIDDPFMQFLASGGALNAQREPSQDVNRILNQVGIASHRNYELCSTF